MRFVVVMILLVGSSFFLGCYRMCPDEDELRLVPTTSRVDPFSRQSEEAPFLPMR